MPIEVGETDEQKKAEKVVREMLVQVRDLEAVWSTLKKRTQAPKITAKLGNINSVIYQIRRRTQNDMLSRFPAEIQHMIWSHLTSPADRLMLALSCKSHTAVFEELKGSSQRSTQAKKSAKATASSTTKPKSSAVTKKTPTKVDRLHVLVRLEAWMPSHYRICYDCVRFKPKTRPKRKMIPACDGREMWSQGPIKPLLEIEEKDIIKTLRKCFNDGPKCPDCNARAFLDLAETKSTHQKLKRELSKYK